MRLFTPLSPEEAVNAEARGELPGTELFFADRAVLSEAEDDAVWVAIDMPEEEARRFESASAPELGYREYVIPAQVASRCRPRRVIPQTPAWWGDLGTLRTLLLYDWDPIGVVELAGLEAIYDEYDDYLEPIANLLASGASAHQLAEYLSETRVATMGLPASPEADARMAERLLTWHRRLPEDEHS